jgi:hypothetical protein
MFRWLIVLVVLMIIPTGSLLAQGFNATWNYTSDDGSPLYTSCAGTTPIPDGRIVKIFWDVDGDGPDLGDPQPTICDVPPLCETGPLGTVNVDHFTVNGTAMGLGAGYFMSDIVFASVGTLPVPSRFYLRIFDTDGTTILWTSVVKTLPAGPQDIFLQRADWTCGPSGPQCVVRDAHE